MGASLGTRAARLSTIIGSFALAACVSNHQVSPFPPIETIHDILPPPNLEAHVKRIDDEAMANGYRLRIEQKGKLPDGDEIVIRGYVTTDPFGREAHVTRVATPVGVILALGPPDPKEVVSPACELVPSLLRGGWFSGTDLNGDGVPEVVVRDGAGVLSVWRVERYGASPLPIELSGPPTHALDVNGDGHPDFATSFPAIEGDLIAPVLVDAATFDESRYSDTSDDVRAWHAKERDEAAARVEAAVEAKAQTEALRAAVERAFHAVRAGGDVKEAVAEMDRVAKEVGPLSSELRESFETFRGKMAGWKAERKPSP